MALKVTAKRVEAEWLYVAPKARESKLFEREGDEITLGEKFKAEGRALAKRTRPTALFLSVSAQFKGRIAEEVLGWVPLTWNYNRLDGYGRRHAEDNGAYAQRQRLRRGY